MRLSVQLLPAALLLLACPLAAQTITGRVVDFNGVGVPNVDIDVQNNGGGGDPSVSRDFTDAAGNFSTTITPAGVYDIVFTPPKPPTTTHLKVRLVNRAVVGVVNLGTIVLPRGASVAGRVLNTSGQPVGGVDFDVKDVASGANIELSGDRTDVFGNFLFAVPRSPIEFLVDTTTVALPTYAPRRLELGLSANTNLGDLVVQPGFTLSGTLRVNGVAVSGADFDARDSATGQELFLLGDNSSATGAFSFIVAAGTYDLFICPKVGDLVVAMEAQNVSVAANLAAGVIPMQPGVLLSGHVSDCAGAAASGVDVEIVKAPGIPVPLCRDDSDAFGDYAVVVPTGTLTVLFRHPTLGNQLETGVLVNASRSLDAQLSPVAASVRNGAGVNPLRYASLTLPRLGTTWSSTVDCSGLAAGLALQVGRLHAISGPPGPSGQLLVGGLQLFTVSQAHGGGTVTFAHVLPNDLPLCGLSLATQVAITTGPGSTPLFTNAVDIVLGQ